MDKHYDNIVFVFAVTIQTVQKSMSVCNETTIARLQQVEDGLPPLPLGHFNPSVRQDIVG